MKYFSVEYAVPGVIIYEDDGTLVRVIPGIAELDNMKRCEPLELKAAVMEVILGKKDISCLSLREPFQSGFAEDVLRNVCLIRPGKTMTYGEIARLSGSRGYRAVGTVCRKNRFPLIIPCHRVVGAVGPGGYAYGTDMKHRLLEHERSIYETGRGSEHI